MDIAAPYREFTGVESTLYRTTRPTFFSLNFVVFIRQHLLESQISSLTHNLSELWRKLNKPLDVVVPVFEVLWPFGADSTRQRAFAVLS